MSEQTWTIVEGEGPIVAAAIHGGHTVRDELRNLYAVDEAGRLYEEDPFTDEWTAVAETRIVVHRSRFEFDLNRPREKAVYIHPDDAWGIEVWKVKPSRETVETSLALYDVFYEQVRRLFQRKAARDGRFVVLDLHAYNHRREGPDAPAVSAKGNPEVNLGTGTMDRSRWRPVVERFMADLRAADFLGRELDVGENVKFRGGHFSRWIHEEFPESGCVLAIEFKKFFMDEWTGEPYREQVEAVRRCLAGTIPGILEVLTTM